MTPSRRWRRDGGARVDRLMQDERTLAATITLRTGDTAWFWKIAYDEARARASPGVQLTLDVTESLLADASVARVDSCATADHPMIDHLWRERLALGGSARSRRAPPRWAQFRCRAPSGNAARVVAIATAKIASRDFARSSIRPARAAVAG